MKPLILVLLVSALAAFLAACTTTAPVAPAKKPVAAKTVAPTATTAVATVARAPAKPPAVAPRVEAPPESTAAKIPPPPLSPEAEAVVERLTSAVIPGTLRHELSGNTGFPEAIVSLQPGAIPPKVESIDDHGNPQPPTRGLTADGTTAELVEKDWTGLVLVPVSASLSKAYTSAVRLVAVEAHPLTDGRVRVWTRVRNVGGTELPAEVACTFRIRLTGEPASARFYQLSVPAGTYRDVFFVSPLGELIAYTVLVRSEAMTR